MSEKNTAIKTEKLVKKFGDLTAVNELSIEIYRGEIFGFLGPNGAGKTTAINMICGILEPSEGEVIINGSSIKNRESVKNQIGICPQENVLWPKLTCFEQLVFMGEMYGKTGRTVKIIHSGLLPLRRNASTTCSCLLAFLWRCPDVECIS